jgi:hypothetical protein
MSGRSADDIQRDIENARAALGESVDKLAYRTSPRRFVERGESYLEQGKSVAEEQLRNPVVIAAIVGGIVTLLVLRRLLKR